MNCDNVGIVHGNRWSNVYYWRNVAYTTHAVQYILLQGYDEHVPIRCAGESDLYLFDSSWMRKSCSR